MKAKDFDKKFERGESLIDDLDLSMATRPLMESESICLDLPKWMLIEIDETSKLIDVSRQSLIRTWLAERLVKNANR